MDVELLVQVGTALRSWGAQPGGGRRSGGGGRRSGGGGRRSGGGGEEKWWRRGGEVVEAGGEVEAGM